MLCCLLFPLQSMAQAQPSSEPLGPVSPPPLLPAPGAPEEGQEAPPEQSGDEYGSLEERDTASPGSPAVRIPVGILLGTLGGVIGALPGTTILFEDFCLDCSEASDQVVFGLLVGMAGMTLGSAVAVNLSGDWLGGQGTFGSTFVGALLGMLGGLGAGGAVVAAGSGEAGLIVALMGPAVGGVLAYELSDTHERRMALSAMASKPRVVPMVTVSKQGGLIGGLVGIF